MPRFIQTDQEVILTAAERLLQSDDPVARLAGTIALLEPIDFDDKGKLITPRSVWTFAEENLQTGAHIEQEVERVMSVTRWPRRFSMSASLVLGESGTGRGVIYVGSVSAGGLGRTASYGELYLDADEPPRSSARSTEEAQHLEISEHLVEGVRQGRLTTESKFSQYIVSLLESSDGVPGDQLGARLDVLAKACLDSELRNNFLNS